MQCRAIEERRRLIAQIRGRWPSAHPVAADSGFARDPLMAWCENNGVDYLFGLPRTAGLLARSKASSRPPPRSADERPAARRFQDFAWRTLDIGAASAGSCKADDRRRGQPRSSSLAVRDEHEGGILRSSTAPAVNGEPIKECSSTCFPTAPRPRRCAPITALVFASMAYVLICALRCIALAHTQFARAAEPHPPQAVEIGALVRTSVRRVKLAMPRPSPYRPSTAPPMQAHATSR